MFWVYSFSVKQSEKAGVSIFFYFKTISIGDIEAASQTNYQQLSLALSAINHGAKKNKIKQTNKQTVLLFVA